MEIIAEIGSVHDGSFGNACKLIEAAAGAGADVVKLQTHVADAETLPDAPMPAYFSGEPRMAYFERTAFTVEQWKALAEIARSAGVGFMSSPFAGAAIELLEEIRVDAYKVASGEVSNLPLLQQIAQTGRPVYLSSGMSDWNELDRAVEALSSGGPLTIMQCASAYPCPPEQVGLNVIGEMRARYSIDVGYSDHTMGVAAPFAAAALGASVIEKHFTFSRLMYGSDARHSMEPDEFKDMCVGLRDISRMLECEVNKDDLENYTDMRRIFQKSIVSAGDIDEGMVLSLNDLAFKKPGDGIPAADVDRVVGRRASRRISKNTKILESDLK